MTIKRFSGTFKTRNDVFDSITPNNVVQPNVSVPAGEWKPAAWLPIQWQGTASLDYFVISSGKVVALDRTGRVVPAGLATVFNSAALVGTTVLTYTQADIDHGTIDIRTGDGCDSTHGLWNSGNVTAAQLATAVLENGWVLESENTPGAYAGTTLTGFDISLIADVRLVLGLFISKPVGICAYDVYAWAGDSAAELNQVNYQKQHLVQFFTDIQLQVPVMTDHVVTSNDLNAATAWAAGSSTSIGEAFPDASIGGTELFLTRADLVTLDRYAANITAGVTPVVAYQVANLPAAAHTDRTPVENSTGNLLVRQRTAISRLSQAGDWFWDAPVGMLFVFSADGATDPSTAGDAILYYDYATASVADAHRHVNMGGGEVFPGDYLTFDTESNLTVLAGAADSVAGLDMSLCVGRCLAIIEQPQGLLDRVRTAWNGTSFGAADQMPGTATKGFTDLITINSQNAGGSPIADKVAVCNLKIQ